jgi:hypothetical protein
LLGSTTKAATWDALYMEVFINAMFLFTYDRDCTRAASLFNFDIKMFASLKELLLLEKSIAVRMNTCVFEARSHIKPQSDLELFFA